MEATMKEKASPQPFHILVVDDAPETLEVVARNLSPEGYVVFTATSVEEAIARLSGDPVDLVITDLRMPRVSGMDLIQYVRENFRDVGTMMITGYPSIEGAVQAVKTGAEEYLVKPFTDMELLDSVRRMREKLELRRTMESTSRNGHYGIAGESKAMLNVFRLIGKAASSRATVLISGESGTGKELVARAVHYHSDRRSAPFITVNCTAIPDSLLESELFGHVKGAFTGARASRAGFFQIADGGTIFLDEIGDASPNMQGKLLSVIQNREICMVGSSRTQLVDVRIVAATNKDLQDLVKKELFREDLYYRLNVIHIPIPPLRDRGDDILLLTNHFTKKVSGDMKRPVPQYSDAVLRVFRSYSWPGNVRELENLIQRVIVMADENRIDVPDLPPAMRFHVSGKTVDHRPLSQVEAEHIRNVIRSVGGNKTRAAEILGIDRKTLREKLKS
jgi:DNA-binding NtrC family response regulator